MRSYKDALAYSAKWLDIIKQDSASIDEATAKWISKETKENFVNHFNAGWVNYRKSMTEAGDYGAVEWRGKGARFYDHFGNEYLDFLGGYGALDLGWSHPRWSRRCGHRCSSPVSPARSSWIPCAGCWPSC